MSKGLYTSMNTRTDFTDDSSSKSADSFSMVADQEKATLRVSDGHLANPPAEARCLPLALR